MLPGRDTALPFWIPARFFVTGMLALAAAYTALAVHPEWLLGWRGTPAMLAVAHTLTLLFVTLTFAGAAQQLAPVLLETPLRSTRLARWSFPLIFGGSAGVVGGFVAGFSVPVLAAGGVVTMAGLAVVTTNLVATALRARSRSAADTALVASFLYLLLTAAMGTLVALGRVVPTLSGVASALPLHLGLGLFGAFFLGIAGAGHKLLGMFTLSHGVSETPLRVLAILVHAAMATLAVGTLVDPRLHAVAALLLGAAALLLLVETAAHLRARRKRHLEAVVRHWLAACAFLGTAIVAGAIGAWIAAVAAFLAGFLPVLITGMGVKIFSFLTWQHRFAPHVGKRSVPLLRDLPLAPLEPVMLWGLVAGGLGATLTYLVQPDVVVVRIAMLAGAAGAWAYVCQGVWILRTGTAPAPTARPSSDLSEEAT